MNKASKKYVDFLKGYANTLNDQKDSIGIEPSDQIRLILLSGMIAGVNEAIRQAERML